MSVTAQTDSNPTRLAACICFTGAAARRERGRVSFGPPLMSDTASVLRSILTIFAELSAFSRALAGRQRTTTFTHSPSLIVPEAERAPQQSWLVNERGRWKSVVKVPYALMCPRSVWEQGRLNSNGCDRGGCLCKAEWSRNGNGRELSGEEQWSTKCISWRLQRRRAAGTSSMHPSALEGGGQQAGQSRMRSPF